MAKHLLKLGFNINKSIILQCHNCNRLSYNSINTSSRTTSILSNKIIEKHPGSSLVKYSTESAINSISNNKYFERLKHDIDEIKRVNPKIFNEAIEHVTKKQFTADQALILVRSVSMMPAMPRDELIKTLDNIWSLIKKSNLITKDLLIELIQSYRSIGRSIGNFEAFLKDFPIIPDKDLLEELLWLACENGQKSSGIVEILNEIKKNDLPLTISMFNALILGHSRNKDIDTAERVLETVKMTNLESNSQTFTELIRAYIENNCTDQAMKLLTEKGTLLNDKEILSLIRSAELCGFHEFSSIALIHLSNETLKNKRITPEIRNICSELVRLNKYQEAIRLLSLLPSPTFESNEDIDTFGGFLIDELVRKSLKSNEMISLCQMLVASGKNTRAFHICCESALRCNSNDSMAYLTELSKIETLRPHYFWPMIVQSYGTQGENGLLTVISKMKNLKVPFDLETFSIYIWPRLGIALKDPIMAIKMLEDRGIKMSQFHITLIQHLLSYGKVSEALKMLQTFQSKLYVEELIGCLASIGQNTVSSKKSLSEFASLMKILREKSQTQNYDLTGQVLRHMAAVDVRKFPIESFLAVLEEFNFVQLKISRYACDALLQYVAGCKNDTIRRRADEVLRNMLNGALQVSTAEEFNTVVTHPRDMSLEELECHLLELEGRKMNTRGVLRRILQLSVRAGKLQRALEVKRMCDDLNVNVSPGMLASIFDLMVKTKSIKKSYAALKKLKETYPNFSVDEHKIIDFAAMLAEMGRIDEAKKVLENHANETNIRSGANVLKNVWQLLTNVATTSAKENLTTNQTKDFLEFLIKLGYCEHHNTLLGPIIREHLLKNDYRAAINSFIEIVKNQRKTPLHYELMVKLVHISNTPDADVKYQLSTNEAKSLLQEVIKNTTSVHGSENTNVSLICAFAESGTDNQLRKLLIDPNVQINQTMFIKQCEYLCGIGATDALIKLAKCSRGLPSSIKEEDLYKLLLNEFVRKNDCNSALGLFERIIEYDEFKLSQEFTKILANLLERNNLEVPSSVKMHARSG